MTDGRGRQITIAKLGPLALVSYKMLYKDYNIDAFV